MRLSADRRKQEREDLVDTLRAVGPDAPTLCGRWSASDIAGHIVTSEQAYGVPMFVGDIVRRALPPRVTRRGIESLQSVGDRMISRAKRDGWGPLLERLGAGPPLLFRTGSLADLRLVEEWIHHEDIRRANGLEPRPASDVDAALWDAGMTITRYPEFMPGREEVQIETPDGQKHRLGSNPRVRVVGRPGELLLYLAGRGAAAKIEVHGDSEVIAALELRLAV